MTDFVAQIMPGIDTAGMRALAGRIDHAGSELGVQYRRLPGAVAPALGGRWSGKAHQAALTHCENLAGAMNVANGAFGDAAGALRTFADQCDHIEQQLRDLASKLDNPPPEAAAVGAPVSLAERDSALRGQAALLKIQYERAEHAAAQAFFAFQMSAPIVGKPFAHVTEPGLEATNDTDYLLLAGGALAAIGKQVFRIAGRKVIQEGEEALAGAAREGADEIRNAAGVASRQAGLDAADAWATGSKAVQKAGGAEQAGEDALENAVKNVRSPGHNANVTVVDADGRVVVQKDFPSGGMSKEDIEDFPNGMMRSHSERKAMAELGEKLEEGDTVILEGELPPCTQCKGAMNRAAEESGAVIIYEWPGGRWIAGKIGRKP
jgi:uncharacterized protein YukE